MAIRWKRWGFAAIAAIAVYAAVGFWAVPSIVRQQLAAYAHDQLQRKAEVTQLSFNPFTLRMEATGLKLAEADGSPILDIGRLAVEMQWRSLVTGAWRFAEIALDQPTASLLIAPDGRFNIAELVAAATRGSQPSAPSPNPSLPRVVIERFAMQGGRIDMQDRQAGYSNTLAPIDFEVTGFSTLPDRNDEYTFTANSKGGGAVRWKGHSSVNPIRANGEFAIDDASLPELSVYLKSRAKVAVAAGKLSATLPYELSYADGKFDARLQAARFTVRELALQDETAGLKLATANIGGQLTLQAAQKGDAFDLKISDASLALADVAVAKGAQAPQKIARAGFDGGALDLVARRAAIGRVFVEGGQFHAARDRSGAIDVASWIPKSTAAASTTTSDDRPARPWTASVRMVQAGKVDVELADEQSGVKLHVADAHAQIEGAGTDLKQPVKFDAGFSLREGGEFAGVGTVVPDTGAVKAQLKIGKIALTPLQPLLAQYVKLKITGGAVSAQGQLTTGSGQRSAPALRYDGSFNVDGLTIRELDNDVFASWRNLGAAKLTASVSPNRLEIPELRIAGADAKLIIEEDRSFNAARLLVKRDAAAAPPAPAASASATSDAEAFPVRIRRVRIDGAKLDFTDLSLRPQFAAKIHELNGVVNGLSTSRTAHAQIELDGRVDEFGMARIRGETSLAAPRDNTDVNFVFRNVDMVPASPYSMKFAGYRIAEGKISLDLQYKIRSSKLEGDNRIVIDKLTLGERVDSPDAMKIPLQLAIAVLQDSDGRIDLGLPVSGDLDDPQFSYGAVVWKAIANVLTKIVTAPFRALGAALGIDGGKLEAIDFDAGSGKLQPPEREKLKQVAQILAKRASLKLSIPGQYSPAADGAALRARAVRIDVAQQAGVKLAAGEEPGPLDFGDRSIRSALREVYAKRFGDAELDKAKKAAETAAPAAPSASSASSSAPSTLPLWQRAAKMIQGEPQVGDATSFYTQLRERLEREHALPADALAQLGAERAKAIAAALAETGVDSARFSVSGAEAADAPAGKTVPIKLGLAAR